METNDIVIVGGGKAGSQAVASLRDEGFDGSIRLVCEEVMLPYDRPPLSKGFLTGEIEESELALRASSFYEESRAEVNLGVAAMELNTQDRVLRLSDGRDVNYGELVLATGASVRPLPFPGGGLGNVLGLKTVSDAAVIRAELKKAKSVVVIGGGFIGLEVASAAAVHYGCQVTLLEALPRLMSRTGLPETASFVQNYHQQLGVTVLVDTTVVRLDGNPDGRVRCVVTNDGRTIDADVVVFGIGVDPRTELAVKAGIEAENGIVVDESLQTSATHVWAIGDCASFPSESFGGRVRLESVQNATDQARSVARQIVSSERGPFQAIPWFWSDQDRLKIQSAGLMRSEDQRVVIGNPDNGSFSVLAFREGALVGGDSVNAPVDHMSIRRLLNRHPLEPLRLTPQLCTAEGFNLKQFARSAGQGV